MKFKMNKKRLIKLFLLLLTLTVAWGFIWSWFITRSVRDHSKDSKMKSQHAVVKNIIVTETQDMKKYWEFYAKSGEYDSENNSVKLNDIIGNFYDKDGQVVVSFQSNTGTYDEKTKKVVLNGDNLIVSKDGSQLFADELIWQGQDKDILANGNIQYIKLNEYIIKAQRAIFNSDLTVFRVEGDTITKLYSDNETKKKYTQL